MLANPIPRKKENRANKINLLEEILSGIVHPGQRIRKSARIKCFPSTLSQMNLKTLQSPVFLDLCLTKLGQGNHVTIVTSSFSERVVFQIVSCPPKNAKPAFLNSSGLRSVFQKAPFSWRISVDDRHNRRNKAAFSDFSSIVWTCAKIDQSETLQMSELRHHYGMLEVFTERKSPRKSGQASNPERSIRPWGHRAFPSWLHSHAWNHTNLGRSSGAMEWWEKN